MVGCGRLITVLRGSLSVFCGFFVKFLWVFVSQTHTWVCLVSHRNPHKNTHKNTCEFCVTFPVLFFLVTASQCSDENRLALLECMR